MLGYCLQQQMHITRLAAAADLLPECCACLQMLLQVSTVWTSECTPFLQGTQHQHMDD
jgi:hypothetical protein